MDKRVPWEGVFTALITPFNDDGSLDEKGLAELVRRQLDAGIHGLVPCGTTGETPAMTTEEWEKVIEITVQESAGEAWVVAGTGTNNTRVSAERTIKAQDLGADGGLVITPYYNKPTNEGILRHFAHVAHAAIDMPIMVYNVPSRTAINLTPDALEPILELPTVVAVKEASGNIGQVWEIASRFGENTTLLSGDDATNLPFWEVGGDGCVSVLSNLVPEMVVEQYDAHKADNREKALDLHSKFAALSKSLFVESSPAPAKYAFKLMGLPAGPVREPLAPLRDSSKELIKRDLQTLDIL